MKYIGLDIHPSTTTFVVMDQNAVILKNYTIETNGRLIVNAINQIQGPKKIAFEECELSHWFFSILEKHVDNLIVCNPVANMQFKSKKTDQIDAKKIANLLRGGFLQSVYHDNSDRSKYRLLMSAYEDLVQDLVRVKCRYKSLFRKFGKNITTKKIYKEKEFLKLIRRKDFGFIGKNILDSISFLEQKKQIFTEKIIKENKKFKEIKFLKTIPGIKDIQAAKIVSQVITPYRFKNRYKFFAYCGLIRYTQSSAGKNHGSIKVRGNEILKTVYKMAARNAIKGDNAIKLYYEHKKKSGMSPDKAYNQICRKIAILSLRLWKENIEYSNKEFLKNCLKENIQ